MIGETIIMILVVGCIVLMHGIVFVGVLLTIRALVVVGLDLATIFMCVLMAFLSIILIAFWCLMLGI